MPPGDVVAAAGTAATAGTALLAALIRRHWIHEDRQAKRIARLEQALWIAVKELSDATREKVERAMWPRDGDE